MEDGRTSADYNTQKESTLRIRNVAHQNEQLRFRSFCSPMAGPVGLAKFIRTCFRERNALSFSLKPNASLYPTASTEVKKRSQYTTCPFPMETCHKVHDDTCPPAVLVASRCRSLASRP
ncbi:hypothetical protein QOT17_010439 [Balamuthia mandrillaris]